ncbi:MAG: virulence RhuM family protein [Candidatus Hydrogenedentota bacterium]
MADRGSESNVPESPSGQVLIYQDGARDIQVRLEGETVWLTQRGMAELYQIAVPTVNHHVSNIYKERELAPEATIRKYLIVQTEGARQVRRAVDHYNLDMILAVGYRVRSHVGMRFRQWATSRLSELLVKGFALDDERIKLGRNLGSDYFDELLERIRDIRASERLFYQKITDIYATSIDYDPQSEAAQTFFATVQNKLHFAVHGRTAAELILERADACQPNMGLTTWKNAPTGPVRKADVTTAKNYLNEDELTELNRIVSMYLDYAEDQARKHRAMHMADWEVKLDAFLRFNERDILDNAGSISSELGKRHAHDEFDKYDAERRRLEDQRPSDFDRAVDQVKRIADAPLQRKSDKAGQTQD